MFQEKIKAIIFSLMFQVLLSVRKFPRKWRHGLAYVQPYPPLPPPSTATRRLDMDEPILKKLAVEDGLNRQSKSLKVVGYIKIIIFLFRRVQNNREYWENCSKVLGAFDWQIRIKILKYRFAVKNEKQKRISTLKNLSPRWISIKNPKLIYIYIFFFSLYSQRLTTLGPPRRDPFWISRKNAKHRNP